MGILNVTPDSFSDGGAFLSVEKALAHARAMITSGADIIDVGGESTRPGAEPVSVDEEIRRVVPIVRLLCEQENCLVSVDTSKSEVAKAAIEAGAEIVNDVCANRMETSMWETVSETGAGYIMMHMQGTPQTMQTAPSYHDVSLEVFRFFEERLARLSQLGVESASVMLDPGIGFGKLVEHNLELLANLGAFVRLERPLLLGVSRKSFLGQVTGARVEDRMVESVVAGALGVMQGAHCLRVHDVAETVRALQLVRSIREVSKS